MGYGRHLAARKLSPAAMGHPLSRRATLAGALGGSMAYLALEACTARADAGPLFAVCRVHPLEGAGVALVGGSGAVAAGPALPDRGHGICLRPGGTEAVVFARRPGTFAAAFEPASGLVRHRFDTPPGRHFYGHGVFEPTGRLLFATENDVEAGRGVLGVYDAADGYRRVGELDSFGVGPHDITLLPDGRTAAVANGGILTRPETGRAKLNLDSMRPSLAYLELDSGRLLEERRLAPGLHQLSIRHLALGRSGLLAAGMQWEGPAGAWAPLLALDRGRGLEPLEAPEHALDGMAGYVGSVAIDGPEQVVAASCPRGSRTAFWEVAGGRFLRMVEIADACAIGPAGGGGRFLTATGVGEVMEIDAWTGTILSLGERSSVAYDNHLTMMKAA